MNWGAQGGNVVAKIQRSRGLQRIIPQTPLPELNEIKRLGATSPSLPRPSSRTCAEISSQSVLPPQPAYSPSGVCSAGCCADHDGPPPAHGVQVNTSESVSSAVLARSASCSGLPAIASRLPRLRDLEHQAPDGKWVAWKLDRDPLRTHRISHRTPLCCAHCIFYRPP
jgi:hypothetical protein